MKIEKEKIYSAIIGSVVADALGVPYEFTTLEQMQDNPATGMTGYGTYHQPVGTWSDDSSLTLALLDSLQNGVDYTDIIFKFSLWFRYGKYTPHDEVFDYGGTTAAAITNFYKEHKKALECGISDVRSNGNGSLMRIMPALLYARAKKLTANEQIRLVDDISSLTHAHPVSKASCNIYNFVVQEVMNNGSKDFKTLITDGIDNSRKYYEDDFVCFNRIYNNLFSLDDSCISSTGYVVDSLEVALYCCYHTNSYRDAVLKAVNYGGDTDTNAMITGGLAALYYGYDSIPNDWLGKLVRLDYIKQLCDDFYQSL